MISVVSFNGRREIRDRAEADDPEAAVTAGRALWDDAVNALAYGAKVSIGFYVNGKLVRLVAGRP